MTEVHAIIESIRQLGPDAIRERLDEIDKEAKALRTLLRSSLAAGKSSRTNKTTGTSQGESAK